MNCKECRKALSDASDRQRPVCIEAAAHVEQCEACRDYQRELTMLEERLLRERPAETTLPDALRESILSEAERAAPRRSVRWRIGAPLAAAAAILVALAIWSALSERPQSEQGSDAKVAQREQARELLGQLASRADRIETGWRIPADVASGPMRRELDMLASDVRRAGGVALACLPLDLVDMENTKRLER